MDLTAMTEDELYDLIAQASAEVARRQTLTNAEQQIAALTEQVYQAHGGDGREWVTPESWAPYPMRAIVTEASATYRSKVPANVWGPPSEFPALWERVWPDGDGWTPTNPGGPQEWDATKTYYQPAAVTLGGATYDLNHVVATPGQRPDDPAMWAVWKRRG